MRQLHDLTVTAGTDKNVINYETSEEASGLIPVTKQPFPQSAASNMGRPVAFAGGNAGPGDLSGMTKVRSVSGAKVEALLLETANVRGRMNPVVQFSINNTGVGATDQKVRIGSVAAFPDSYARFNLTPGAADNAIIRDQLGVGCLKVQGFSDLINYKPVVINEIHLISADLTQLNTEFFHKLIHPDLIIDDRSNNIAFTQQKTDQKETLNVAKGKWLIDSNQFLEFTVFAANSLTILLHMVAIANVDTFTPVR